MADDLGRSPNDTISVRAFCAASEPEPPYAGFYSMRWVRFSREEAARVWKDIGAVLTAEERNG